MMELNEIKSHIPIKPYYECESGALYCADCMDILPCLPNKCVDLVLTDPPYGRKITKKDNQFGSAIHKSYRATGEKWDDKAPAAEAFAEIIRISKNQIIFGGNHFNLPISEKWIVWDKTGGFKFDNPFSACELAWTNFGGVIEKYTVVQQGFVSDTANERFHPTQKPTELFDQILTKHKCNIVLDPYAGSGTSAVVCRSMQIQWLCIEIDEGYCQKAVSRLQAESQNITVKELKKGQKVLF